MLVKAVFTCLAVEVGVNLFAVFFVRANFFKRVCERGERGWVNLIKQGFRFEFGKRKDAKDF